MLVNLLRAATLLISTVQRRRVWGPIHTSFLFFYCFFIDIQWDMVLFLVGASGIDMFFSFPLFHLLLKMWHLIVIRLGTSLVLVTVMP